MYAMFIFIFLIPLCFHFHCENITGFHYYPAHDVPSRGYCILLSFCSALRRKKVYFVILHLLQLLTTSCPSPSCFLMAVFLIFSCSQLSLVFVFYILMSSSASFSALHISVKKLLVSSILSLPSLFLLLCLFSLYRFLFLQDHCNSFCCCKYLLGVCQNRSALLI